VAYPFYLVKGLVRSGLARLSRAVQRYQRLGVWSSDATLPRSAYDRLAERLRRGGLIVRVAPYELICDDRFARRAEREARAPGS